MSDPRLTLTAMQRRFVEEYLIDLNGTQAAIRAGHSKKTAAQIAHNNLKKPNIQAAMKIEQDLRTRRVGVTVDRIVTELAKIGFANLIDYVTINDQGDAFVDFSKVDRDQMAAVIEISVEEYTEGRGDMARDIKRTKFKMADKRAALVDLGKHLGMFVERKELNVNHTEKPLTSEERRARISELIGREAADRIIEAARGREEIPGPPESGEVRNIH